MRYTDLGFIIGLAESTFMPAEPAVAGVPVGTDNDIISELISSLAYESKADLDDLEGLTSTSGKEGAVAVVLDVQAPIDKCLNLNLNYKV